MKRTKSLSKLRSKVRSFTLSDKNEEKSVQKRRYSQAARRSNHEESRRSSDSGLNYAIESLLFRFYFEGDEFLLDVNDPEFFVTDGPSIRFTKEVTASEMKTTLDLIQEMELELRKIVVLGTGAVTVGAAAFLAVLPETVESVVIENEPRLTFADHSEAVLSALVARIGPPTALWHLSLRRNQLDQQSAPALAEVIRSRPQLRYLNLADNALDDSAVETLCEAFQTRCNLRKLVLQGNRLTDVGASTLASLAIRLWDINSLNVLDNLITRQGMAGLQRAWSGRTPFKFLLGPAPRRRPSNSCCGELPLPSPKSLVGFAPKGMLHISSQSTGDIDCEVLEDSRHNLLSSDIDESTMCFPCDRFTKWFWKSKVKKAAESTLHRETSMARTASLASVYGPAAPGTQGCFRIKRDLKVVSCKETEPVITQNTTVRKVSKLVRGVWLNVCYLTLSADDPGFVSAVSLAFTCVAAYFGTDTAGDKVEMDRHDKLAFSQTWAEISLLDELGQEMTHRFRLFHTLIAHGKHKRALKVLDESHPIVKDMEPKWKVALWIRSAIPGWELSIRSAGISLTYNKKEILPTEEQKEPLSDNVVFEAVTLLNK